MYRTHDRSHFYKYMPADTAMKVISSHSLRWSCPLVFNDPFDHQIGFSGAFDREDFGQALLEEMIRGGEDCFRTPTPFSELALRLHTAKDRRQKDAMMKRFVDTPEVCAHLDDLPRKISTELQRHLTHSRVLCLAEENDNVVMWSHYADQHRGVVLQLRCVDEIDNTLLSAQKVNYSREFPSFFPLASYVRHLIYGEPLDAGVIWKLAFTKHEDWSYEKEWRLHRPLLSEPPGNGYTLYNEDARVFGDVYLGCRMADTEAVRVIAAVKEHIPHAKVFRGKKSDRSFSLEFEEV